MYSVGIRDSDSDRRAATYPPSLSPSVSKKKTCNEIQYNRMIYEARTVEFQAWCSDIYFNIFHVIMVPSGFLTKVERCRHCTCITLYKRNLFLLQKHKNYTSHTRQNKIWCVGRQSSLTYRIHPVFTHTIIY